MKKAMTPIATMALKMGMALALAMTVSGGVLAHNAKPKHGGIMREVNELQFELVNNGGAAKIYVEDHGKIHSTVGASGKLTVLNGTKKTEVALQPTGENVLEAGGEVQLTAGAKVVASITFADKKTVSVRFAVK